MSSGFNMPDGVTPEEAVEFGHRELMRCAETMPNPVIRSTLRWAASTIHARLAHDPEAYAMCVQAWNECLLAAAGAMTSGEGER